MVCSIVVNVSYALHMVLLCVSDIRSELVGSGCRGIRRTSGILNGPKIKGRISNTVLVSCTSIKGLYYFNK
jgi:hypothetical protein